MLTFLFALFAIWTLFWFVMLMLDWGDRTPFTNSKVLCATCAAANGKLSNNNARKNVKMAVNKAKASNNANIAAKDAKPSAASTNVKAAASKTEKPSADADSKSKVTPLFEAPKEKDDLKIIKGIGVVMEKTLNDLGITTFAQLAGFSQSDVDMVSERLSESNSGFGDRITRDEWVDQAKVLAKKAA